MNDGGGNGASCFEIKKWADTTKDPYMFLMRFVIIFIARQHTAADARY